MKLTGDTKAKYLNNVLVLSVLLEITSRATKDMPVAIINGNTKTLDESENLITSGAFTKTNAKIRKVIGGQ